MENGGRGLPYFMWCRKRMTWSSSTSMRVLYPGLNVTPLVCQRSPLLRQTASRKGSDLFVVDNNRAVVWTMVCWSDGCHYERQISASLCSYRCMSLQLHFQLFQCQRSSCSDINEQRAQKRAWQRSLNMDIQKIMLELMVNIFRSGVIWGNNQSVT